MFAGQVGQLSQIEQWRYGGLEISKSRNAATTAPGVRAALSIELGKQ